MKKSLSKASKIDSDDDLKSDGKYRDHVRHQWVMDATYRMLQTAIYIIPSLLLLFFVAYIGHLIYANEWVTIKSYMDAGVKIILGYVIALVQKEIFGKK